ncbi:hypothetical protein [Actinokineospora sp. NBRC 105648]|uniref:hypothetical protein n=1 Tax=Actinokineospora sp. NBRC 105648 TaxID=3032206 RepID=UPI0024A376F9|nr:hypothetical protein [Actinokineospora sp. NBRC 105648]GLZ41088.1 hypothetical protein Acsp05_47120 [Actinokineospora sp. NBRC 105648]
MPTRRATRYAERGQLECGFRVLQGHQDGLTTGWRHGLATLAVDHITFVATIGGVRFLKRQPIHLTVEGVNADTPRQPSGREIISASPVTRVIQLRTPTAVLEWAILADQVTWAVHQVNPE